MVDTSNLYSPGGHLDYEEDKESCQASRGPSLHAKEIAGCDALPVRADEGLPGCLFLGVRIVQQTKVFHYSADCLPVYVVAQATQFPVDAAVSLELVFTSHSQNQITDHVLFSRGRAGTPLIGPIILAGNQFPMPAEYCLWREQSSKLSKQNPTNYLALARQTAFLLYAQKDAFSAKLFPQDAVFLTEVSNHLLLLLASGGHIWGLGDRKSFK